MKLTAIQPTQITKPQFKGDPMGTAGFTPLVQNEIDQYMPQFKDQLVQQVTAEIEKKVLPPFEEKMAKKPLTQQDLNDAIKMYAGMFPADSNEAKYFNNLANK